MNNERLIYIKSKNENIEKKNLNEIKTKSNKNQRNKKNQTNKYYKLIIY